MTPTRATRRAVVKLDDGFRRPIAHRGLHDASCGITENTAPAFAAAIARGYGIECDLRPIAGGKPVVFHDLMLDRLIDGTGPLSAVVPTDLAYLRHRICHSPILTLDGLLTLVVGRVPLLIEVKSEWGAPDQAFLTAIADAATHYRGPLGLMSFDPDVVATLADLAPTVPRGLVSGSYRSADGDAWWQDQLSPERARTLRDMADVDRVAASFCAYEVAALPTAATILLRQRGFPVFTWTVRTASDWAIATAHADAAIFEGTVP